MGRSLNMGQFTGRLGGDPEMKYTTSGTAITNLNLAVSDDYFDKNTESWVERTQWINCTAFGATAERIAEKYAKGDSLYVRTTVRNENWEKDGVKHYSYSFIIDDIIPTYGKGNSSGDDQESAPRSKPQRSGGGSKPAQSKSRRSEPEDPF